MNLYPGLPHTALALLLSAALTACGGSSSSSPARQSFTDAAILATGTGGAGAVELIDLTRTPFASTGGYFPVSSSDLGVTTRNEHYYRIGRYQFDTVQKVDIGNPAVQEWQFSTLEAGDESSSNPHRLIFASDTKAYLLRYGSPIAWIVDPSATREADFKIGELDLSHYNGGDNTVPNMTSGIIVDGKLFIVMQRLNQNWTRNPGYVAVFDIATDEEIDTGVDADLPGIKLIGLNPSSIAYHPGVGILVQSVGGYGDPLDGGVDHIDPASYAITQLIDDDEDTGAISAIAIMDADTAYLVSYLAWGDNHILRFNPVTGAVDTDTPVAGNTQRNIAALSIGPDGNLWVADATNKDHGIRIIDPATDTELDFVPTSLPPTDLAFITSEE